jgi:uncharacterized protein (DUF697 family)
VSDEMDVTPAIFELALRNKAAEAVIRAFAAEHALVDVASGLVLGLVPGGSMAAIAGQLAYSAVRVYPAMVKKLVVIYGASPDDFTRTVVAGGVVTEAGITALIAAVGPDVLGHIALDAAHEFGSDFFQEIVTELLQESSVTLPLSFIPVAGAIFGAALDAIIGATITWRVGCVVSAYFQYGGYIGSRKETYEKVKRFTKRSADVSRPGTLDRLRSIDEIRRKQRGYVRSQFRAFLGSLTKAQIRDTLVSKQGIPADIVDAVAAEF